MSNIYTTNTSGYNNPTVTTSTGTHTIPFPDVVEFGKAFDISVSAIAINDITVKTVYQMALDDFFKAKAENFPGWEGIPEIRVSPAVDSLRRIQQVGWYVQVPRQYVIDADQALEETLWDE
jgi:hypothetical protein